MPKSSAMTKMTLGDCFQEWLRDFETRCMEEEENNQILLCKAEREAAMERSRNIFAELHEKRTSHCRKQAMMLLLKGKLLVDRSECPQCRGLDLLHHRHSGESEYHLSKAAGSPDCVSRNSTPSRHAHKRADSPWGSELANSRHRQRKEKERVRISPLDRISDENWLREQKEREEYIVKNIAAALGEARRPN